MKSRKIGDCTNPTAGMANHKARSCVDKKELTFQRMTSTQKTSKITVVSKSNGITSVQLQSYNNRWKVFIFSTPKLSQQVENVHLFNRVITTGGKCSSVQLHSYHNNRRERSTFQPQSHPKERSERSGSFPRPTSTGRDATQNSADVSSSAQRPT